jgi:hypothetical protein
MFVIMGACFAEESEYSLNVDWHPLKIILNGKDIYVYESKANVIYKIDQKNTINPIYSAPTKILDFTIVSDTIISLNDHHKDSTVVCFHRIGQENTSKQVLSIASNVKNLQILNSDKIAFIDNNIIKCYSIGQSETILSHSLREEQIESNFTFDENYKELGFVVSQGNKDFLMKITAGNVIKKQLKVRNHKKSMLIYTNFRLIQNSLLIVIPEIEQAAHGDLETKIISTNIFEYFPSNCTIHKILKLNGDFSLVDAGSNFCVLRSGSRVIKYLK